MTATFLEQVSSPQTVTAPSSNMPSQIWTMDQVLQPHAITALIGKKGTAKSWLASHITAYLSAGLAPFGSGSYPACRSLCLHDGSESENLINARKAAMKRIIAVEGGARAGWNTSIPLVRQSEEQFFGTLGDLLENFRPRLVVMDKLTSFCDSDDVEHVSEFMRRFVAPTLAVFQCAALVLHTMDLPASAFTWASGAIQMPD